MNWHGKPYYSLDAYFKNTYGEKCYKIAVDAGCTCPNRDGTLDTRGCIFCSAGGSGDFAVSVENARQNPDNAYRYIDECIRLGISKFNKSASDRFVIYFQAYTNTYGNIEDLKNMWEAALQNDRVVGISIATRPDCLGREVTAALSELKEKYCISYGKGAPKFIWVELGLQTIHKSTELYIRRHYGLEVFDRACDILKDVDIPFIVHVILGLPGESREMMFDTVKYVNGKKPFGIKLQLLHVLKGTDLASDYENGSFEVPDMEEYVDLVCRCVEVLDENIVIHRLTGDGPKSILVAPEWSGNKKLVLNALHKTMKERGCRQGSVSA